MALHAVPDPASDEPLSGDVLQPWEADSRTEFEDIRHQGEDAAERFTAFIEAGRYGHLRTGSGARYASVTEFWDAEFADTGTQLLLMITAETQPRLVRTLRNAELKQAEIAERLGISQSRVSRILAGKTGNEARDAALHEPPAVSTDSDAGNYASSPPQAPQTPTPAAEQHIDEAYSAPETTPPPVTVRDTEPKPALPAADTGPVPSPPPADPEPLPCGHDAAWHERAAHAMRVFADLGKIFAAGKEHTFNDGWQLMPPTRTGQASTD